MFRHTLPHSCYLIFHFKSPKALVDWVQYLIALVTTSPSIKAGNDNPMWTREVRAPVHLKTIVHPLTAWPTIPAQDSNSRYHHMLTKVYIGMENCGVFTYTSIRRGYFLDFLKFVGNIIWYQRSVSEKNNKLRNK